MNREAWSLCWGWIFLGLSFCSTGAAAELLFETMPVPRSGGFRMDGYWVWDPSVVKAADGKWHFFASRWPHSNPMHPTWLLTSEIVRAEGSRPEGPFEFKCYLGITSAASSGIVNRNQSLNMCAPVETQMFLVFM